MGLLSHGAPVSEPPAVAGGPARLLALAGGLGPPATAAVLPLRAMDPQTKFVVEGDDLWQAIRKRSCFAQEHRQSAGRQS